MYRLLRALVRFVLMHYLRVEVVGLDHLPATGGYILAANHASALDPFLLGAVVPRPVRFLAKAELFPIPVVGWLLRQIGMIPVHRGQADRGALTRAKKLLMAGEVVGVFPEGTRSEDGHLQAFHGGTAWLAWEAGVPIVPAAVLDSWQLWPRGRKLPRRGRVTVVIGSPLPAQAAQQRPHREQLQALSGGLAAAIGSLFPSGEGKHTISVENESRGKEFPDGCLK